MAWELLVGPRTPGLVIDHLCFNKLCQNPAHMEEVPQGENARRGRIRRDYNRPKSHCPHGHELAGDNLHITPQGWRVCKQCNRDKALRYQRRRRASAH